jgi:hypothetical protein
MPDDRFESPIIQIGDRLWAVLPDEEGRYFVCPVKYTGYTMEVTEYGKVFTHFVSEVDFDDEPVEDEEETDIALLRWTKGEALQAFNLAFPAEPVFGEIYTPTIDALVAAGV